MWMESQITAQSGTAACKLEPGAMGEWDSVQRDTETYLLEDLKCTKDGMTDRFAKDNIKVS